MDYKKGLTIIESTDIDVEQKMLSMCSQIEDKYDYVFPKTRRPKVGCALKD